MKKHEKLCQNQNNWQDFTLESFSRYLSTFFYNWANYSTIELNLYIAWYTESSTLSWDGNQWQSQSSKNYNPEHRKLHQKSPTELKQCFQVKAKSNFDAIFHQNVFSTLIFPYSSPSLPTLFLLLLHSSIHGTRMKWNIWNKNAIKGVLILSSFPDKMITRNSTGKIINPGTFYILGGESIRW